jgi:hypothetical protein
VKTVATAVLLITLAGCPLLSLADNGDSSEIVAPVSPVELANNLSDVAENTLPTTASAQDLSIFAVISLGVIGLLWIRRHTSEL